MNITELTVAADTCGVHITWEISEGEQSSFDLFLLQKGSVIKRVRTESAATQCILCTAIMPMREYALLLTVQCGERLSSARTSFFIGKKCPLKQSVIFHTHS